MQESIQQLNQYLEQMLECVEPIDRVRFGKLNRDYTKLMNKTFADGDPVEKQYDTMRNEISHALMYPELSTSKVREFLNQA